MNTQLGAAIAVTAAYFIGSLPSAYIMGRLRKGIDIRAVGSRNMGAMNSIYYLGFIYGVVVLLCDIGKGMAAVALAHLLGRHLEVTPGWWLYIEMASGFIAVIGHNFPVWLKFKGGKGGATVIGAVLYFIPWGWLFGIALFAILLAITRVPTISYGLAMLSFPLISWLIYHNGRYVIFITLIILIPFINYIPRLIEMRRKGGTWKRVFSRKSIKDRF
ncbi:MAG: glycerol-3-phosphate acyltransferase [Dehalococcoidia bacterium]|nr:glycerol-3-phosphate acyltransferase [Dehalococcoidia bacterium]